MKLNGWSNTNLNHLPSEFGFFFDCVIILNSDYFVTMVMVVMVVMVVSDGWYKSMYVAKRYLISSNLIIHNNNLYKKHTHTFFSLFLTLFQCRMVNWKFCWIDTPNDFTPHLHFHQMKKKIFALHLLL